MMKKFDFKGIKFKTWALFFSFALIILISLWFLQTLSLKPYYRSVKVNAVKNISTEINSLLDNDDDFSKDLTDLTYDNNLCLSIYNHDKEKMASVNAIGLGCYIGISSSFNDKDFLEKIDNSENNIVDTYVTDERFEDESLIYGTKVESNLDTYYLILDAAVEPVESTVFIIRNQFYIIALIVLFFSAILAYFFSKKYSTPITEITNGARKLSEGDYSINQYHNSFSEINELSSTLNYAATELSKVEELQKELLANVSHDIKTPLTTIKAYAEMILDISGDNKVKRDEHLDVIINETNHLNKLVNDMITLSRMEKGNYSLNVEAVDLVIVVEQMISLLKGYASDIKIIKKLPKNAIVYADQTLIGQVVYNFMNNAIKHAGKDKTIIVEVVPNDIKWQFNCIDHGEGISDEEMPYIWDRYYKADKRYARNKESSGLGLAISKAYLDAHHFKYGALSKVNEGSTFYFIADSEPISYK